MRILVATAFRGLRGGVETYLRSVMPALILRGHRLALLYEDHGSQGQPGIDDDCPGMPAWQVGSGGYKKALRQIENWAPDLVFLHGLGELALEDALRKRFRTALYAHGYQGTCVSGSKRHRILPTGPCARSLGPACLALYYPRRCGGLNPLTMLRHYRQERRRCAMLGQHRAVLVASSHMQAEYRRHGVKEERIHLVPLFPPGQVPDPAPPPHRPIQRRVLMVGRLTDAKGGRFLIEAAQRAAATLGGPLTLVVAGDGPERLSLEALARTRVNAEFVGWVDPVRRTKFMREADVLAVPSVWPEPFGLVGIEAGCVGLPAIGFAVGGIPDWLLPGQSGELAPGNPPTVGGLAAALCRALRSPTYRERLSHGAWEVAHRFTLTAHVAALQTVFEGIASSG